MADLKKFALNVHNFVYRTDWDDESIVSAMDFDGIVEEMKKDEKELEEENKKLAEQVRYWKNFALFYWSGHQLGKEVNSDSDVWRKALEQVNENNDCDVEQLTKKCMWEIEDN